MSYDTKDLFLRTTQDSPILEGPIFDPAMLHTKDGFAGNMIAAGLPLPKLNWWPGMNNTISSLRVLGMYILYNATFFRGASRVFIGVPYFEVDNLAAMGFNNRASSVFVHLY